MFATDIAKPFPNTQSRSEYKISDKIKKFIEASEDDDTIMAFVQLKDKIDFDEIDKAVYRQKGISKKTIDNYYNTTFETDDVKYLKKESERRRFWAANL